MPDNEETPEPVYGVFGKNGALLSSGPDPTKLMQNLTVKQFNLMLRRISVTRAEIIGAMEATISDPLELADAIIEYDFSVAFERTHPLIGLVAASLGFDEEQMDAMWLHAQTL